MTAVKGENDLGKVIVQVQDDLRQLRRSINRIAIDGSGEKLDIQKHAEQCLKAVNNQMLVLPIIEDFKKPTTQIHKWKPALENIPELHSQRDHEKMSPGEKHRSALTMRLLYNPTHPKNRTIMNQRFGIPLPDVHKKSVNSTTHHRGITGLAVASGKPQEAGVRGGHYSSDRDEQLNRNTPQGVASRSEKGVPSPGTGVCSLDTLVHHKAASLHHREQICAFRIGEKSSFRKQLTWGGEPGPTQERTGRELTPPLTPRAPAPPAAATSRRSDQGARAVKGDARLTPESPQGLSQIVPVAISKFQFTITEGQIDSTAAEFCRSKQQYCSLWDALRPLEKLLREFAVPLARVNGEQLAELGRGWGVTRNRAPPVMLLSALENREEVLGLVLRPGQRYKGEGGIEAAATRIQSSWRCCLARKAYLHHRRRKWAAGTLAISWVMRAQTRRVRKALQTTRFRQLENHRRRAQHLAANWKHIQSSERTIIHIPSLGYSQSQRLGLKGFDILQNTQISRLADVRDENVEVIYVSPRALGDDITRYYARVLEFQAEATMGESEPAQSSVSNKRFTIVTPEALDYFPTHNMCLSTLLKYSPLALRRLRNLIQGKQAYIVGGVAHADDLAVADDLGVPILGPEPAVARLYGTKSGGRRIFAGAEVAVAPGHGDIYFLDQLHETLARLMTDNMEVRRWVFKMDSEFDGRGTAHCDVSHLPCHAWVLQEYRRLGPDLWSKEWAQEYVVHKYLDEIPRWLACYARPVNTSCFPDWARFLKTFLRQGGMVEASPPSPRVTCLTMDLLLEPGGEVTMLSCGDQLHGSCPLTTLGSSVPQASVRPDALRAICMRVGQACFQRQIIGYVSIDLATFLDHSTMMQKVWAVDLDLRYSDQLAMTQMLLSVTGGTLDCLSCHLQVPSPIKETSPQQPTAAKRGVARRCAVTASRLFHSNLSMVHHNVFFNMCKAQGIGYDIKRKQGTVFVLHDSSERSGIGMLTVSADLQGALLTFARNLSVIHQEISSPKMQGDTNFKDLLKDIEEMLQITAKNKVQALEDKE